MTRILVVEDEHLLAESLQKGLAEEHYAVDVCHDGEEALWALSTGEYDLVLLDLMIPKVPGMEVCRRLRARGNDVPILMLTARDSTKDVVAGLDCGAGDYLTKPFAVEELLARIRRLIRAPRTSATSVVAVGGLKVDLRAKRAFLNKAALSLNAKEYALLEYLALHRGEILSKGRLLEALWERDGDPDSNVVEVYVARLRKRLGADVHLIHTVRGQGYALSEEPL